MKDPYRRSRNPESSDTSVKEPDEDLFRLLVRSVKDYSIFLLDPKGVGARSSPIPSHQHVIVLFNNPREVDRCFALGCNAYLTKPVAYEIPGAGSNGRYHVPV